jgi:hypothetical protein
MYSRRTKKIMQNWSEEGRDLLASILGDGRRKTAGLKKGYALASFGEEAMMREIPTLTRFNQELVNPPVDMLDEAQRVAYEVKTFSANSKDLKVKNGIYKTGKYKGLDHRTVKEKWAESNGYRLRTAVVVVGHDGYEVYVKDGYGNFRPSTMVRIK